MINSDNLPICPCESCLVLPMCRNRLDGKDFFDFCYLGETCPQFRKFLDYARGPADSADINTIIQIAKNSLLKGINFNEQVDWNKRYTDEDKNLQSISRAVDSAMCQLYCTGNV